jgi:hypothetical protein
MFPPHPNSDKSGKKPDSEIQAQIEQGSASLSEVLWQNAIFGCYFFIYNSLCALLPPELSTAAFAWMICGLIVMILQVRSRFNKHLAKVVTNFSEGAKFFGMALLWPLILMMKHPNAK